MLISRKYKPLILYLVLFLALSGCGETVPESAEDEEIELVPLVAEATPTPLPQSWTISGEIVYQDEYGESNYSMIGQFTVNASNKINGDGSGLIQHTGPCFVLTRSYDFNISGEYDPEAESFLFEELFDESGAEVEEDDGRTNIIEDRTFDPCSLGESLGEMFALLRPLVLLGEADHGATSFGEVPVAAAGVYGLDFTGGSFTLAVLNE